MNTLPNDLTNLVLKFLDAAEWNLVGFQIEFMSVDETVRTNNFQFILYHNKKKLMEYAVYHKDKDLMDLLWKHFIVDDYALAFIRGLIRRNDIQEIKNHIPDDEVLGMHGSVDGELFSNLIITAVECKNKDIISLLTSLGHHPPTWNFEKILSADYNGDIELLDYVLNRTYIDNEEFDNPYPDIDYTFHSPQMYIPFDDWKLGLDRMIKKGDLVCADYFRKKIDR